MKFSTREDIEAPIEFVFQQVTDFSGFERQALRRGADVRRNDHGDYTLGSNWDVAFTFRGKDRKVKAKLAQLDGPNVLQIDTEASGINGVTMVELVPLSPKRTRIVTSIDLRAKSLSARLLLQSLKLAKSNLTKRFKRRVAQYSEDLEDKFKRSAG